VTEGRDIDGIAERARVAGHKNHADDFTEVKGIQCVEGCREQYRVYLPVSVPAGDIELCRRIAKKKLREELHPNHSSQFLFSIPI